MQSGLRIAMVLALVLGAVQASNFLSEKPSELTPCIIGDPGFNKCYARNFQVIFREWRNNVPGIKSVPPLDPLLVKRIKISQSLGPTTLNMDLRNVTVTGISAALIQNASLDRQKKLITVTFYVPKLGFESAFKAKGTVLGLNINGQGTAMFHTEKTVLTGKVFIKERYEHGHVFHDMSNLKIEIDHIENFHLILHNLFGGNKPLEDSANELFNSNWRDIYPLLRPAIEQTVAGLAQDRFKKIFSFVPADYFVASITQA